MLLLPVDYLSAPGSLGVEEIDSPARLVSQGWHPVKVDAFRRSERVSHNRVHVSRPRAAWLLGQVNLSVLATAST